MVPEEKLEQQVVLYDSSVYANIATGVGGAYDPTSYSQLLRTVDLNHEQATNLYNTSVGRAYCDGFPNDMVREGRRFIGDAEAVEEMLDIQKKAKTLDNFRRAQISANVYGGSVILIHVEGAGTMNTALVFENIEKGAKITLKVVDRNSIARLEADNIYTDDYMSSDYMKPKKISILDVGGFVHPSRILWFHGDRLPVSAFRHNGYWNKSVLESQRELIQNLIAAEKMLDIALAKNNQTFEKVQNLYNRMANPDEISAVKAIATENSKTAGGVRNNIIDASSDVSVLERDIAGMIAGVESKRKSLAMSMSMPLTKFGFATGGMTSTDTNAMQDYFETVKGKQISCFNENIEYLDTVFAKVAGISKPLPFVWNPLQLDTAEDEVNIEKIKTETVKIKLENFNTLKASLKELVTEELISDDEYKLRMKRAYEDLK